MAKARKKDPFTRDGYIQESGMEIEVVSYAKAQERKAQLKRNREFNNVVRFAKNGKRK